MPFKMIAKYLLGNSPVQTPDMVFRAMRKALSYLALPVVLVVAAAWVVRQPLWAPLRQLELLVWLPYVAFLPGLVLAWRFNRSRAFFTITLLGGCYLLWQWLPDASLRRQWVLPAALLVPLNIAVLAWSRERGIFNNRGFARLGLIIGQCGLLGVLAWQLDPTVLDWLEQDVAGLGLGRKHLLPPMLQLLFIAVLAMLVVETFLRRTAVDGALMGTVLAMLLSLAVPGSVLPLDFFVAGLVLLLGVVQDSYVMAYYDELTSLPARRALNEQLLRLGNRYTIAMVDVDHFKKFNDTYGHDVGDQVLRFVAAKLERVRSGGKAFRYGGEEFTLLFPNRSASEVMDALQRVHEDIAASGFVLRAKSRPRQRPEHISRDKGSRKKVGVTVSMGVASRDGQQATPRQIIKMADKALYQAKEAGRNQIWSK